MCERCSLCLRACNTRGGIALRIHGCEKEFDSCICRNGLPDRRHLPNIGVLPSKVLVQDIDLALDLSIRDVLFFDAMLTPKVVTLVYWLLLVTAVIAGLGSMFYMGFQYMTFGTFVRGLAITIGGAIGARIWCELVIVLFKLNENVQRIANSK